MNTLPNSSKVKNQTSCLIYVTNTKYKKFTKFICKLYVNENTSYEYLLNAANIVLMGN